MQENVLCLLSNAVKYSSTGEVTLSVSLSNTPRCECDTFEYPVSAAASDKTDKSLPLPFYMSRERRLPPTTNSTIYDSKSSTKQTRPFYDSNKEHRPPSPTPRSDKSTNSNTNSRTVFFTNRQRHIPPPTPVYDNNRPPPFYMSQERRLPPPLSPPLPLAPLPKPTGMMRQRPSKQDLTDPACFTSKTIGSGKKVDDSLNNSYYNSSKASTPTGNDLVDDVSGGLGALGQGLGALGQQQSQQYLMIEVADNGIGIPADKIDTLFAPFKQTQRFAGGMYILYTVCMLIHYYIVK